MNATPHQTPPGGCPILSPHGDQCVKGSGHHLVGQDWVCRNADATTLWYYDSGQTQSPERATLTAEGTVRPERVTLTDEERDALHQRWRIFKHHRPSGAYPPVGQLDGDCGGCGESWPCAPVSTVLAEALLNNRADQTETKENPDG